MLIVKSCPSVFLAYGIKYGPWGSAIQWKLEHRKLIPKHGKESYNECGAYRTLTYPLLIFLENALKKLFRIG